MGLSSAMTTALTGLHAAETQIDVAGNNLANSQTVGFKASDVIFANQFLRTLSQGSPPSESMGGTNPRQIGMGVEVAAITPDFTQGTIELGSSPSDLAIQGNGFFIVEGSQGEHLYTRDGIFRTNSSDELVSSTGHRLLGYGVDEYYTLQQTSLVPLEIPLGKEVAAQATQNVYLTGNLTPTGDVADTAAVIDSDVLYVGDLTGPTIDATTPLVNVVRGNGVGYENLFAAGELTYSGRKGGNALTEKTLDINGTTTVADFLQFLDQASGIQTSAPGDPDPIPDSINRIPGESGTLTAGSSITADGRLRIVSNNGTATAIEIPSSAFQMAAGTGTITTPNLGFTNMQEGVGQSATSDFLVYDTLGVPLNVRLNTVLESRDGQTSTYRWFADSGDNDPAGVDQAIAVGTGLISFDGEGNLIQADNPTVTIGRNDIPSTSPLVFDFDFAQVTGFAAAGSEISASRQDGSSSGTLSSFSVGEGGEIMGVFSNGITRTLGQIRLAQFANPLGLDQRGENMFGVGFNSGLPVEGNPGELGLGTILGRRTGIVEYRHR